MGNLSRWVKTKSTISIQNSLICFYEKNHDGTANPKLAFRQKKAMDNKMQEIIEPNLKVKHRYSKCTIELDS